MKKYVFVLVLMFGFIFCLQGQPKNNPGKRITDYVSVDVDGKVDSIHYTYSTQFDSLPSVINRKYADYGVHMDSIIYDLQGRTVDSTKYYWMDSIGYIPSLKSEISYDDYTGTIVHIQMRYDSIWSARSKVENEFFSDGTRKRANFYEWGQDSLQWYVTDILEYNANGQIIERISLGSLKLSNRYNSEGIEISFLISVWDGTQHVGYYKSVNQIENGRISKTTRYRRSFFWGIWRNIGNVSYTFNSEGMVSTKKYQDNSEADGLINTWLEEYHYDDQQRLTVHIQSDWDIVSHSWKLDTKLFNYYAANNSIDSTRTLWNQGTLWSSSKTQFNTDSTSLKTSYFDWDNDTESWILSNKSYRWDYEVYVIPPKKESFVISTFPNPASEYVTFYTGSSPSGLEVYIYSLSGQVLATEKLDQVKKVYVGDWPTGIYYYLLLQAKQQVGSGSILKQ